MTRNPPKTVEEKMPYILSIRVAQLVEIFSHNLPSLVRFRADNKFISKYPFNPFEENRCYEGYTGAALKFYDELKSQEKKIFQGEKNGKKSEMLERQNDGEEFPTKFMGEFNKWIKNRETKTLKRKNDTGAAGQGTCCVKI